MTCAAENIRIIRAQCMGLCGGVRHALELFSQVRAALPPEQRLYVVHELCHNRFVTGRMRAQNAVFVTAAAELPAGAVAFIGAHGLDRESELLLQQRASRVIDATCPMVKRLQQAAAELLPDESMVFFGGAHHPECIGVCSRNHGKSCHIVAGLSAVASLPPLDRPVFFSQTTMNACQSEAIYEALRLRFPNVRRVAPVCSASSERQNAVLDMLPQIEALVVVGSPNSSNANRLRELGVAGGIPAWLVDEPSQLPPELWQYRVVGITAGASTPGEQIEAVAGALESRCRNAAAAPGGL